MPRIILPESLTVAIRSHGERAYPHECCGVLAGALGGDVRKVTEIHPLTNLREKENAAKFIEIATGESSANRYLIDPAEQMRVERDLTKRGLDALGFYHSHPNVAARPSKYDLDHAWPFYIYVIVSVRQGQPAEAGKSAEMTAWLLRDDRSAFDSVEISTV